MLHYAYLPQCALQYLSFFFCFFLKCLLIGCAVTVACFKHPMWHLKMAYLTPAPAGRKPHIRLPKPMNRVTLWHPPHLFFLQSFPTFTSFSPPSIFTYKNDIQKAFACWAPSEAKSAWFQHLLIILTYGQCLHECLPASVSHFCQYANIPSSSGQGEWTQTCAPWDPGPVRLIDLVAASPYFQLGCISTSERPERTVIPPWGHRAAPHFNPLLFQPQWETCAYPAQGTGPTMGENVYFNTKTNNSQLL